MIVTIDGPAGTGKSTVARILAERLGFEFLNTGAMYRAVAYACLQRQVELANTTAVGDLAGTLEILFSNNHLLLNGLDVTEAIRGQEVTQSASIVAANPIVRKRLVELQRQVGQGGNLVTEGRDQGTTVFPDAECKFFLTASPAERALRRQRELNAKGDAISLDELLQQQELRDRRDESRACSPLKPADDALQVDTTEMSLDQVAAHLERLVQRAKAELDASFQRR
ncbi:(d)CMP kinase [Schlesneria paludicola]|uniref:(d)CMP kinase n=1 Tax=Schlesneria paludicola TaxID=360056 RepID=UPI00029A5B8C|nr:(d)CMP kinase [Schlesneria paludicola]